jgi:hypothetical protein
MPLKFNVIKSLDICELSKKAVTACAIVSVNAVDYEIISSVFRFDVNRSFCASLASDQNAPKNVVQLAGIERHFSDDCIPKVTVYESAEAQVFDDVHTMLQVVNIPVYVSKSRRCIYVEPAIGRSNLVVVVT